MLFYLLERWDKHEIITTGLFFRLSMPRIFFFSIMLDCAGIIVSTALLLFVANSLVFARYFVHLLPLCMGEFLMLEGLYYFGVSLCGPGRWQRSTLAVLCILVLASGVGVFYLLLGFGVCGLPGLAAVSGIAPGLSCAYALTACLLHRGKTKRHMRK